MAKQSGFNRFLFAGILFGIIFAAGVLMLKNYIGNQLITVMQEEAAKSCDGCKFQVKDVSVSLLNLSALAREAHITENNRSKLSFKKIRLYFDLSQILSKKVSLSLVSLEDGLAEGFTDESVLYKFIDQLSSSPPKTQKKSSGNNFKLKLEKLQVTSSRLTEDLGNSDLIADNFQLALTRNRADNFELQGTIRKLKIVTSGKKSSQQKEFVLGRVSAVVELADQNTRFLRAQLKDGKSKILARFNSSIKDRNALSGKLQQTLTSKSLRIDSFLKTKITGGAKVAGRLSRPEITGNFKNTGHASNFKLEPNNHLKVDQIAGDYQLNFTDNGPELTTNLELSSLESGTQLTGPLYLDTDKLSGDFQLSASYLKFNNATLNNITGQVKLSGSADEPIIEIEGLASSVDTIGVRLPNIKLSTKIIDDEIKISATGLDNTEDASLNFDATINTAANNGGEVEGTDSAANNAKKNSTSFQITAKNYHVKNSNETPLGNFSGKAELTYNGALNGQGTINFQPVFTLTPSNSLLGDIQINNSILTGALSNSSNSLKTNFNLDLSNERSSQLEIVADKYWPDMNEQTNECSALSANLNYNFFPINFFAGDGELLLKNLALGCAPRSMKTKDPQRLSIKNGQINIDQLKFYSTKNQVNINGQLALNGDLNLKTTGTLELSSLLPLLPKIDDLQGRAELNATIGGNISQPSFTGSAALLEAGLSVESANIELINFQGTLQLQENQIKAKNLTGELNQGAITIDGELDLLDTSKSFLAASFDEINLQPDDNTSLILTGNLTLQPEVNNLPRLSGNVRLITGIFEQEIRLKEIIANLAKYVFSNTPTPVAIAVEESSAGYPDIELAIKFSAERNFYIVTNLINSELASNLEISGTINAPKLQGNIRSLSGWFGFGERRFEIISANIGFQPESFSPEIDILGESEVLSRTGDLITIFLEISGDLNLPTIRLTSDRNLSHNEILALLGNTVKSINTTEVNLLGRQSNALGFSLIPEDPVNSSTVVRLLSQLTKIDNLSIEPALNRQTGLIEPQFVARKNLAPKLILQGESFVGSASGGTRAKLLYRLAPKLNVAGIIDSADTQRRTALGVDLTYTILAKRNALVNYKFTGNQSYSPSEILEVLRLNETSQIAPAELGYLNQRLTDYYVGEGYLHASTEISCLAEDEICVKVFFEITENDGYTIQKVKLIRDPLPKEIAKLPLDEVLDKQATKARCEYLNNGLIRALRNEGYLQARSTCEYQPSSDKAMATAAIKLSTGLPVSFVFYGNLEFSERQLLDTIKVFERKQPFGNNSINILTSKINNFYKEQGFPYVNVEQELLSEDAKRNVYRIQISEGPKLKVSRVSFSGNQILSKDFLRSAIRELGESNYAQFFLEEYALEDKIAANANILKNIYEKNGFRAAAIKHTIKRTDDDSLQILYQIIEGSREELFDLQIKVLATSQTPEVISDFKELSSLSIQEKIDREISKQKNRGYLKASIVSEEQNQRTRQVAIKLGKATKIKTIKIRGNKTLSDQQILDRLELNPGDPWSKSSLSKGRGKLLRSGLISQAVLSAEDGQVDQNSETLLVQLTEKPLTTLEVGAGANSELGAHFFGEASDLSLFKDGRSISTRLDLFYDLSEQDISQGTAGVSHYIPEVINEHSLNSDVRFQRFDLPTLPFDQDRLIWETTMYRAQKKGLSYDFGYGLSEDNLDSVEPSAILSELDTGNIMLSKLSSSLRYDQRDNPINPRFGYLAILNSSLNSNVLGSDANYYEVGGKFGLVFPVFDSAFSIANYSQGSWSKPFSDTEQVPLAERYFTGGRNSLRGFNENSLGPEADDGTIIGGDVLLTNNLELRYRTSPVTSLHLFLDAGNSFLEDRGIKYEDLRFSTGAGFRYLSPIGPIGFDIGKPLDEKPGEPSMRLHFSIGSAF